MIAKILVVVFALFGLFFLLQTYVPSWFNKIAFVAPGAGAISYALCVLIATGMLMLAKLSWGK